MAPNTQPESHAQNLSQYDGSNDRRIPDILAGSRSQPIGKGTFQHLEKIREGLGSEWTASNDEDEDEDPSPWYKRPGRAVKSITGQSSATAVPLGNPSPFSPLVASTSAGPLGALSSFSSLVANPNSNRQQSISRSQAPSITDSNASRGRASYVHSVQGSPVPGQRHSFASSVVRSRPSSIAGSHEFSGSRARSRSPSKSPSLYHSARGSPAPSLSGNQTSSIPQSPALSHDMNASESYLPSVTGSRPRSLAGSSQSGRDNKRRFAPAFAERLPKIDEYDPQKALKPDDTYRFLKEKEDAKLKGTWLTIDPSTRKRTLDSLFHAERHTAESNRSNLTTHTQLNTASERSAAHSSGFPRSDAFDAISGIADSDRASTAKAPSIVASEEEFPSLANARWRRGTSSQGSLGSPRPAPPIDPRFENPDLDVDESVRRRFVPIANILDETVAPRSAYEQRNAGILTKKKAAPLKVIIGGKVAKELELEIDERGKYQDRFGNYIGKNLGPMKKHLIEERAANIEQRDREMVMLTKEERRLAAMTPAERTIYELEKLAREPKEFWGAVNTDIFTSEDVPDVYMPKYTTWNLRGNWSGGRGGRGGRGRGAGRGGNSREGGSHGTFSQLSSTPFVHGTQHSRGPPSTFSFSDDIIPLDSGASTPHFTGANSTPQCLRPYPSRPPSASSGGRPSTATTVEEPLELSALKEGTATTPPPLAADDVPTFEQTVLACETLPRIVHITLAPLVAYSPGAIATRLFGGSVQEIQFFPRSRAALVAFAFPAEAASFMQHMDSIARKGSAQEIRALQITARWTAGGAVVRAQDAVLKLLFAGASRALGMRGYPAEKDIHRVSAELGVLWGVMFVKVSGCRMRKKREGVELVLEFACVSDAWEVMQKVEAGPIAGYEGLEARWLKDPCDMPGKRSECCSCAGCLV
ncbi:MAG: hypothetical protein M1829_000814 [Trizodia sp. TS-e1964]|nr:MAG: hypothetical protein M1829_000814 [Trizodia sp. TS-e1964]